jgi:hypothetical protein
MAWGDGLGGYMPLAIVKRHHAQLDPRQPYGRAHRLIRAGIMGTRKTSTPYIYKVRDIYFTKRDT